MASLRIAVGAQLESSALTVFQPLEKAAERARRNIETNLGGAAKVFAGPYRTSARKATEEIEKVSSSTKKLGTSMGRSAQEVKSRFDQLAKAMGSSSATGTNQLKIMAATAERELRRIETAAARTALGLGKQQAFWNRDLFGGGGGAIGVGSHAGIRVSRGAAMMYGATRTALGFGYRIGSQIAQGLGVQTDIGTMVSRGVEQERVAQEIVNSGYIPGQSGADKLQTKTALMSEARGVAISTGMDTSTVLGGLQAFVGQTGDLQSARDMLKDMAVLSRATGTSFEDTANAAAQVSMALGDIPDKANVTKEIMRQIAGQGKLGAVEMRDLASQMAKIAAAAGKFEGGGEKNIALLGAIAQEARQHGGAATATQAATSVASLTQALATPATIKNWAKLGVNPYTDSSHTQLSSPDKLIEAALKAADKGKGADLSTLKTLFGSSMAMRAVTGFANVYNQAGGGDAGLKAVREEFDRLAKAALSEEEVHRAFAASMNTTEAQVQKFNQTMEQFVQEAAASLLPAFQTLAPVALEGAQALADFLMEVTGTADKMRAKKAADLQAKIDAEHVNPEATAKNEVTYGPLGMEVHRRYSGEAVAAAEQEDKDRQAMIAEQQKIRAAAAGRAEHMQDLRQNYQMNDGKGGINWGSVLQWNFAAMTFGLSAIHPMASGAEYAYRGGEKAEHADKMAVDRSDKSIAQQKASEQVLNTSLQSIHQAILDGNAKLDAIKKAAGNRGGGGTSTPGQTPGSVMPASYDPETEQ